MAVDEIDPFDFSRYWQPFRKDTRRAWDCLPFHREYPVLPHNTEVLAYLVRSYTIYEMTCTALGHPGGSLSEAEFLCVLYNYALWFDPQERPEPHTRATRSWEFC